MARPATPPPPTDHWYAMALPQRQEPSDYEQVCPNCQRPFFTPVLLTFPHLNRPRFCSRICKVQWGNRRHYTTVLARRTPAP